jgi:hypothetical protein
MWVQLGGGIKKEEDEEAEPGEGGKYSLYCCQGFGFLKIRGF